MKTSYQREKGKTMEEKHAEQEIKRVFLRKKICILIIKFIYTLQIYIWEDIVKSIILRNCISIFKQHR